MRKSQLLLLVLGLQLAIIAQKQGNIWYFGANAGLNFNSGNPVALLNGSLTSPLSPGSNEGSSAISDSSGSILFYSDGMTVWNKNHQVMPNGTGLLGNFSSTQSSIIVPDPADPDRYFYIFTISSGFCCQGNISDGMRYSKVDLCLGSAGDVMPNFKNIKLVDTVAEKIAVTRHINGVDYWILTHKFYSDKFVALRLGATGITQTVVSSIGSTHSVNIAQSQGQMKFSPNGQRIAIVSSNSGNIFDVLDFDKTTGIVSNCLTLTRPNSNQSCFYGVEFSPDNTKVYASGYTTIGQMLPLMIQYDLSAGNLQAVNSATYLVYSNPTPPFQTMGKGLQLGPNGKIYWVSINGNNPGTFLSVINNPNVAGAGCNYNDLAVSLGGKTANYTLPSFIAGYNYSNTLPKSCEPTAIHQVQTTGNLRIGPNPVSDQLSISIELPSNFILTNQYGITIMNGVLEKGLNNIDLFDLPLGLYYIKISNNEFQETLKLLKE